jgi:Xaa-Pro aminopeptidase
LLNGKPYFFHGLLDQGYFSDGIFTPASPEVYTEEIKKVKALGFNTLRKHVKIEPQVYYYDCDRLGVIVWQDMINNGDYKFMRDTILPTIGLIRKKDKNLHKSQVHRQAFLSNMEETVKVVKNHPSVCYYTIFNEGWGQFDSQAVYEKLKSLGFEYKDISSEIQTLASVKTEEEIKYIKKACQIAEKSWKEIIPLIKEGITERELANELEYRFKKYGASGTSFDTIVAFGKNAAVPHHETGDTKLKYGMPILMDFGCVYKGYCSDMTRTFYFGTPTKEFVRAYNAVLQAHMNVIEQATAGMTGKAIDKIARDTLEQEDLAKYFTHSLGHGIGVNIHEYPWVSPKGENTVENGMIFSDEPGVYVNGKFGIRIEDSMIMENGKPRSFMKTSKKLQTLKNGKLVSYVGKGK